MEYTLTTEKEMHKRITELMDKWRNQVEKHSIQELSDAYEVSNMAELFVPDGFYPYYTEQKKRILFIGRECLGLQGGDYIEDLYHAIKVDKRIGNKALNSVRFHALILYTAYGILNDYPEYDNIPYADKLADTFACDGGFSFAFMNLSKLSNQEDAWQKDDRLIGSFLEIDGYSQFFADELQILRPDIIIGMNLVGDYGGYMGDFLNKKKFGENGQVDAYTLHTNNGEDYLFLDFYHFASWTRKWSYDYNSIMKACKNILP